VTRTVRPACDDAGHEPERPVTETTTASTAASTPALPLLSPPSAPQPVHSVNGNDSTALDRTGQRPQPPSPPLPSEAFEPLTGQVGRLHLTVSRELRVKLEAARLALSHARPGATIADLLELGADTAIAQDAKRKGLVKKPRARPADAPPPPPDSDHIPAEVPGRRDDDRQPQAALPTPQPARRAPGLRRGPDAQVPARPRGTTRAPPTPGRAGDPDPAASAGASGGAVAGPLVPSPCRSTSERPRGRGDEQAAPRPARPKPGRARPYSPISSSTPAQSKPRVMPRSGATPTPE
jgi:hypothetical protein